MISDSDLRDLNIQVYSIDPGQNVRTIVSKKDSELNKNERNQVQIGGKMYKVLDTEYDTSFSGGGFKGMAVAPITKAFPNGDKSQVVVVAAGTDPSKAQDVLSAIDASTDFGSDQLASAEAFVNRVQKKYNITQLTGYSQSGYMLKVGAKEGIPTTVFNGWFLYDTLSAKEKAFMEKHPGMFRNFRREQDSVTIFNDFNHPEWYPGANDYGTIIWVKGTKSHSLAAWKFDRNGTMSEGELDPKQQMNYIQSIMKKELSSLKALENKLTKSGGGLSSSEEIYLESGRAFVIADTVSRIVKAGVLDVVKSYEKGIGELEEHWIKTIKTSQNIGSHLSYAEVVDALAEGGCTKETMVHEPTEHLKTKIKQVREIQKDYEKLVSQIKAGIEKQLQSDQVLAKELGAY